MDKELDKFLKKNKIIFSLYNHKATNTVAESLKNEEINKIPGTRCKTLFLKDNFGRFYLVGLEGTKRLDIRYLEMKLGVKNLSFASHEELNEQIQIAPGNVSLLSAIRNQKVIVIADSGLESKEKIGFHPSNNTMTCVFNIKEFIKYFNALKNEKHLISL